MAQVFDTGTFENVTVTGTINAKTKLVVNGMDVESNLGTGSQGAIGPQGATGTQGVQGAVGITGPTTPASADATGTAGTVVWDADYIYVCVATDTWKRAAIATWP